MSHDKVKQLAQVYFGRYQAETSTSRAKGSGTPPEVNQGVFAAQPGIWRLPPSRDKTPDVVYVLGGCSVMVVRRACISLWWKHSNWLSAGALVGFGDKYPNLMLFYALAPGHTVDEVALALRKEIES